ncbi:MAG: hypothetical protein RIS47_1232 [Bacteroidota bacterium]|jgi:PhnB protein
MAQINPYFTFNGNAREAMEFYQQCLGGELVVMPMSEAPMADTMPPEVQNLVMHATLKSDDFVLMASDSFQGEVGFADSVNISLNFQSAEAIETTFAKFAEGAKITMPLAKQFWGATFGSLTDKFGIPWMFNFDEAPAQ